MSTYVMGKCWPIVGITPSQKSVLISLADQSNDQGICWPSIKTIATRTCLSERTVQGAVKALMGAGLLTITERHGTSSLYQITPADAAPPQEMHPRSSCTPPPQQLHPTPAAAAPKPTMNRKEPTNKHAKKPSFADKPDDVDKSVWDDWLLTRKEKRAGRPTVTAMKRLEAQAAKAGLSVGQAIEYAAANSWVGFSAEWYESREGNTPRVANGVGVAFT